MLCFCTVLEDSVEFKALASHSRSHRRWLASILCASGDGHADGDTGLPPNGHADTDSHIAPYSYGHPHADRDAEPDPNSCAHIHTHSDLNADADPAPNEHAHTTASRDAQSSRTRRTGCIPGRHALR
jgi:hypothetical protein